MSADFETADDALKGWLQDNSKTFVNDEGAFCTSFFLVAEYMDADGKFYSLTLKDPTSPNWRLRGLLEYARENDLNLIDPKQDEDGEY